ncbi:MAG: hypothetical protein O9353_11755, partial [Bacteroidia bacterium]|nr:hypothetical protein [Bacteroidia bacterium]
AAKAAADKLAEEKAAAEKLAAEKANAEKTAAEKAAAEQANAAKSAAEKAAAEKAAAEKAAAEKAAAEKAAAEKAAAAKAAADKLAEEKAAAEKLAAEKANAAKSAAEKAAADKAEKDAKHSIAPTLGGDKYKEAISKADGLFKMKRYKEAKTSYEDALIVKAGDSYAKGKLAEIEKLLNSDTATAAATDAKLKALLAKYPPGVTEETISGTGVVIIQRVVVKETFAYVYQKKIFSWGGISYFRDATPITESTFEQETKP